MKILAIGDLHGEVPATKKFLEENSIDLIICPGDFANIDRIRDAIFENWLLINLGIPIESIMGHKQYEKARKKSKISQASTMRRLSFLDKKTFFVFGNDDEPNEIKYKNLEYMHLKKRTLYDIDLIGMNSENFVAPLDVLKVEKLFKKSENRKIFLTHEPPLNTKLDLIRDKKSPRNGQHTGGQFSSYFIKKFQPELVICGHMHENPGVIKIGKSFVVNPGYGAKGSCAIIEMDKQSEIKFYKL